MAQPFVKLDENSQLVVDRGRQAWKSLKSDETWEKWVAIGRAIEIGRNETMRALHTNQPKGGQWGRVFGAWLDENGFDEIDKGVRSRLQNCLDHQTEIDAWRQNIGLAQRLQLNHPNAVWRRWQAAKTMPKGPGSTPPANRKDIEIMRLQSELDDANRKLRAFEHDKISEGRDWDWQDTPQEIAEAMLRLYPDKAKRLGAALQNLAKSTTKKPRVKVT